MGDAGEPEVLQQGRDRRPRGPHSLAIRVTVGVLLVALAGVAVGIDHRVREGESRRVSSCAVDAAGAIRFASARVDAIMGYVRPTLDSGPPPALRRRLLRVVSVSVAPTVAGVEAAYDRCTRVEVLFLHDRIRSVRAGCLSLLTRDLSYLREVVADGSRAQLSRSLPTGACHPLR